MASAGTALRLVVMWVLLLAAQPAAAQSRLHEAQQAFNQGRIELALIRLKEAENEPGLTEDDLVRIHWTRALCLLATGKPAEANRSHDLLLALRPLHEPSALDAAPPVLQAFRRRQQEHLATHGAQLAPPLLEQKSLKVTVLRFPEKVSQIALYARAPGDPTFVVLSAPLDGATATVAIADADAGLWQRALLAGSLECLVEARSNRGTPLARLGTRNTPLHLPVKKDVHPPAVTAPEPVPIPVPEPVKEPPPPAVVAEPVITPAPVALAPAPPPHEPPPTSPRRKILFGVAGAGGGLAVALGVTSALLVAAALSSYGATWVLPYETIGDGRSLPFLGLYYGSWLLGGAALLLALVVPLALVTSGGAAALAL